MWWWQLFYLAAPEAGDTDFQAAAFVARGSLPRGVGMGSEGQFLCPPQLKKQESGLWVTEGEEKLSLFPAGCEHEKHWFGGCWKLS